MTVKFYLKDTKVNGMLKEAAIVVRITFDRNTRYDIATGEKILPKHWDAIRQEAKASFRYGVEMNQALGKIKVDLLQLWRDNKGAAPAVVRDLARNVVKFGSTTAPTAPVQKKTLIDIVQSYIEATTPERDSKTVAKYKGLLSKLQLFSETNSVAIEDITFRFYDAFKAFLYAQPNPMFAGQSLVNNGDHWLVVEGSYGSPVGLFDDTVFKYIINLRAVLKWAIQRGYEIDPSFERWETRQKSYPPICLTLAELERLEAVELTPDAIHAVVPFKKQTRRRVTAAALDIARDYLVMECRTGQRISDIRRFDQRDYQDFKWTLTPTKGNRLGLKKITVHFKGYCAPALMILAKHGFAMPQVAESNINDNIKMACRIAGIDQEIYIERWAGNKKVRITGKKYEFISTHTGRKTFVTIALQYMPPKLVKELAGIESYQTLKHYEGQSEDAIIEQYLKSIPDNRAEMRIAQ